MAERKPIPKTQRELSENQHVAYDKSVGNPNLAADTLNRGTKTSFSGDNVKPFSVGIQDIDEAIFYYFKNVIKPSVVQNGERLEVPIIYGAQEKFKSFQKDGYYRDNKGKIMMPIIVVTRTTLSKDRSLTNKIDANNPNNYNIFSKTYDDRNAYSNFNVLNNRKPEKQFYASVVPDYVTVTYSCQIQTYYVEQLNKIVEAINYASDAYWGDPSRFKFRAMVDQFDMATELVADNERTVKASFTLKINGYVVPETVQKDTNSLKKYTSKTKLVFQLETEVDSNFMEGTLTRDRIVTDALPDSNRKDLK
tara:strand:+ start:424 stop:1344 length:921 start_codon:yes stop_codon:yes gene_type:complete